MPRTLTALGVGAAILVIWWTGVPVIRLFLAVVAGGCCWEIYLRLQPSSPTHPQRARLPRRCWAFWWSASGPLGTSSPVFRRTAR